MRIHFTDADLRKITFAQQPDLLAETLLATRAMVGFPVSRLARPRLPAWRTGLTQVMRPMFALVAPDGTLANELPDGFGVPHDIDTATAALLELPDSYLCSQLAAAGVRRAPGSWAARLATGEPDARQALAVAMRSIYHLTLAPLETALHAAVAADRARRAAALLDGGIDGLLAGLHPDLEWRSPTLIGQCPRADLPDEDIYLDGSGLVLSPSPVAAGVMWSTPVGQKPKLTYPAAQHTNLESAPSERLAALVGRTRAAVLWALQASGSTTQVARRTGISTASASEHTRVLRESGLVVTQRLPGYALHSLTPLGARLLDSA